MPRITMSELRSAVGPADSARAASAKRAAGRRGFALLAVIVVMVVLALATAQYTDLMVGEYRAAENAVRTAQARAAAASGVNYAAALLSSPDMVATVLNGNPFDNPEAFQGVAVGGDGEQEPARFSLIAPLDPDNPDGAADVRFGVSDEGGKINLNALLRRDRRGRAAYDVLVKLPDMTEEIANSILDWIDTDSEPRLGGAESEHYSALSPPYRCKNGPLESLEELLLVKGVTPELLFGKDLNRNGIIDPEEDDGSSVSDFGWSAYLTVYSREQNIDAQGNPLINVNGDDLNLLYESLVTKVDENVAKFIVLYRVHGSGSRRRGESKSGGGGSERGGKSGSSSNRTVPGSLADLGPEALGLKSRPQRRIRSFFELIDAQVTVAGKGDKSPSVVYTSPLKDAGAQRELLPKLFESATTSRDLETPARINVNTAPAEVLAAIPRITDTEVQSILGMRPRSSSLEAPSALFQTPAWLLTEAGIRPDMLRRLEPYVTTRTQVYRVQAVGYSGTGVARVEAVVDTNGGYPRILYWRDLTELGRGMEAVLGDGP